MFEQIPRSPVDPIFSVMAALQADSRSHKIDLGIGVLRTAEGTTPVMEAVQQAERWLQHRQSSKAYLGPAGRTEFNSAICSLLLPEKSDSPQLTALQTPGGAGALRVAGDLINHTRPGGRLWLSDPPWVTHHAIFPAAGLQLCNYRYLARDESRLDFDAMLADLQQLQAGHTVLLQVSGHNPTGCDLNEQQWQQLAALLAERKALPLLDFAYHGLAQSLTADQSPIRIIAEHCEDWLCCYSCSKTFGLYNERTGALLIHTSSKSLTQRVRQEAVNRICANYYMPPDHGAAVVTLLLESPELRLRWQQELAGSRIRINQQRLALASALERLGTGSMEMLRQQQGLFSYLNLSPQQLQQLAEENAIYIGSGGRINISGLNEDNLQRVSAGLATVMGAGSSMTG